MKKRFLSLALVGLSLSLAPACNAGTTPEGTLNEFLTAMKKKDRKTIQRLVDWQRLTRQMNPGKQTPEQQERMARMVKTIYTESFALGKGAEGFKVSPVSAKGGEAKATFLKNDKATKKWVPTTQFLLHKKGKEWLIYGISGVKK